MKGMLGKLMSVAVIVSMLFATACGTLMYPERRGQEKGDLDGQVVIGNALFLLLGVVPGVVAFAVDYSTGALYLPAEGADMSVLPEDMSQMRVVYLDGEVTESRIQEALQEETGEDIELAQIEWEER